MITLAKTYVLAYELHKDQKDKSGMPYIGHPIRVARIVEELGGDEYAVMAAILHDVIEDTPITMEELADFGYPREVLDALYFVTKDYHEELTYLEWIKKIKAEGNERAILVKTADTMDNLDPRRFVEGIDYLYKKYNKGLAILKGE
jgi:(p)ppGpp synthase/HD superfamily hydrolase